MDWYPSSMSERLDFLLSNSDTIKAIAARHKAISISVFGSVARGEDKPESDVDFLVEFDRGVSVLDWVLLNEELEKFLDSKVDVVSMRGLKPRDIEIRKEAVLL